jgi:hypothetical protein
MTNKNTSLVRNINLLICFSVTIATSIYSMQNNNEKDDDNKKIVSTKTNQNKLNETRKLIDQLIATSRRTLDPIEYGKFLDAIRPNRGYCDRITKFMYRLKDAHENAKKDNFEIDFKASNDLLNNMNNVNINLFGNNTLASNEVGKGLNQIHSSYNGLQVLIENKKDKGNQLKEFLDSQNNGYSFIVFTKGELPNTALWQYNPIGQIFDIANLYVKKENINTKIPETNFITMHKSLVLDNLKAGVFFEKNKSYLGEKTTSFLSDTKYQKDLEDLSPLDFINKHKQNKK